MMPKFLFHPAAVTNSREELIERAVAAGHPREEIERVVDDSLKADIFLSECGTYQVSRQIVTGFGLNMYHLSIKRVDREVIHDWRDLQEIKNALAGSECEAIELYPAESRLVDTANQYHLWCFMDPTVRLPVGFIERSVTYASTMGAKQRPRS